MVSRPIGIIVNPQSGKDVRRIVSHASTVTNFEKINIVKRVLTGLAAAGARWVVYMPDPKDLVGKAFNAIPNILELEVNPVNITVKGNELDTVAAVQKMANIGVAAIVTLGGDGTNRLIAKITTDVPLIPISTGTNNIFPDFIEGTKAGFTAGVVAALTGNGVANHQLTYRHKQLKIESDGLTECALIDVAISSSKYIGGKALWEPDSLKYIFVTRTSPGAIGPSGILGSVMEIGTRDSHGGYLTTGTKSYVKAILASGIVANVGVDSFGKMEDGESRSVFVEQGTLLTDGEKILSLHQKPVTITLDSEGPLVVDVHTTLSLAREMNFFVGNNQLG
ncbi:MAG: NAD(+)/NADH kinase [Candidatus Marinimicrobia bacterium]|nr:NAD(+)/NADH kinase [Candidatus Neomarinimicrobiota bacterium]